MSARPKCPECGLVMVAGGVSAPPHCNHCKKHHVASYLCPRQLSQTRCAWCGVRIGFTTSRRVDKDGEIRVYHQATSAGGRQCFSELVEDRLITETHEPSLRGGLLRQGR